MFKIKNLPSPTRYFAEVTEKSIYHNAQNLAKVATEVPPSKIDLIRLKLKLFMGLIERHIACSENASGKLLKISNNPIINFFKEIGEKIPDGTPWMIDDLFRLLLALLTSPEFFARFVMKSNECLGKTAGKRSALIKNKINWESFKERFPVKKPHFSKDFKARHKKIGKNYSENHLNHLFNIPELNLQDPIDLQKFILKLEKKLKAARILKIKQKFNIKRRFSPKSTKPTAA